MTIHHLLLGVVAPVGQESFITSGSFTWTAPAGVTSVCVVAVGGGGGPAANASGASGGGGGGLGWKNNIPVTPGVAYDVVVGAGGTRTTSGTAGAGGQSYFISAITVAGNGGGGGVTASNTGGAGGTFVGDGGGNGGAGGGRNGSTAQCGGGGGAGGYSGAGGNGSNGTNNGTGSAGSGGGGGGGGGGGSADTGGSGGGVGLLGEGANGAKGASTTADGRGGFGGSSGGNAFSASTSTTAVNVYGTGVNQSAPGVYGGGGSGSDNPTVAEQANGAVGAVRIIWGPGRAFPSTNTVDNIDITDDGLAVYLDATNASSYPGTGTTWFDLSGNNRDFTWDTASFTSGSPSYFSTSGRRCTGPASNSLGINNTSGYTIFIVALQNSLVQSSAFKFYKNNLSGSSGRAIFSHLTWNNEVIYFDQGGCCDSDTRTFVSAGTTNTWNVYTLRRLTGSSTRSILKNGSVLTTNSNSASTLDLDSRAIDLGNSDEGSVWNARLGGFIVYNRGLSDTEVTDVYTTIRTRYGI